MKIVILDAHAVNPGDLSWDCFNRFGDVTVYPYTINSQTADRIGDAEIVMTNKTLITEEILVRCPNIRLICVLATGYNAVDCEACRKRGIPVCNVPAYSTNAVAQFVFSLLLEICNGVGHHNQAVHQGKWSSQPHFCFWDTPQIELAGKTMGIIGFGRIGRAVGRIARAMGMEVLAYNRSRCPEGEEIGKYVDLDTLLSKMKKGAILLNTARGGLLVEEDVADALRSGHLSAAAVDVVSSEPISLDNPLLSAPNCIITPHMAWAPIETRQRILDCTVASIEGYLSSNYVNVVNE